MKNPEIRFNDCSIKRQSQRILFEDIKAKCCLGLAGNDPEEYIEILNSHCNEVMLCDFNPSRDYVIKNSLCGAYDMNSDIINWIDADFCSSLITNRHAIEYLFNRLRENKNEFYLTINLSLRGSTFIDTFEYINKLVNNSSAQRNCLELVETIYYADGKYIKVYDSFQCIEKVVQYRNSGSHMLSFLIHVKDTSRIRAKRFINSIPVHARKNAERLVDLLESGYFKTAITLPDWLTHWAYYIRTGYYDYDHLTPILDIYGLNYKKLVAKAKSNSATNRDPDYQQGYLRSKALEKIEQLRAYVNENDQFPKTNTTVGGYASRYIKNYINNMYRFPEAESIYIEIVQLKEAFKK